MPFFNGAIVFTKLKTLGVFFYFFYENSENWTEVVSAWIFALHQKYGDKLQDVFSVITDGFFQYKIISWLYYFLDWNLNELSWT